MKNRNTFALIAILVISFVGIYLLPVFLRSTGNSSKFTDVVVINNKKINVELADTQEKREIGLSGRTGIGKNEGMLFVFKDNPRATVFWMKGMLIPIDIIWIKDNKVIKVDSGLKPPESNVPEVQLSQYPSPGVVEYALEVASGYSEKNNIKVGDSFELKQ